MTNEKKYRAYQDDRIKMLKEYKVSDVYDEVAFEGDRFGSVQKNFEYNDFLIELTFDDAMLAK